MNESPKNLKIDVNGFLKSLKYLRIIFLKFKLKSIVKYYLVIKMINSPLVLFAGEGEEGGWGL